MAYQSGGCDSLAELLAKLRLFAEPIGWVTTAVGPSAWAFKSSQAGDFTLRVSAVANLPGTLEMHGSTGNLVGQLNPSLHPGSSIGDGVRSIAAGLFRPGSAGPYTLYHFFGTLQYLHVVLEVQSGVFAHMHIGRLSKKGMNYSGGEYLQASYFGNSHSRIVPPVNGIVSSGNWTEGSITTTPWTPMADKGSVRVQGFAGYPGNRWVGSAYGIGRGPIANRHPDCPMAAACRCDYLRKALIIPNRILLPAHDSLASERITVIGETPDFGITDISRTAPGDILVYGEDRWMVFPIYRRGPEQFNYSVDAGYAYLLRS